MRGSWLGCACRVLRNFELWQLRLTDYSSCTGFSYVCPTCKGNLLRKIELWQSFGPLLLGPIATA